MNSERFTALFPLKATIIQDIIDSADIVDSRKCIGALTLKSVIPDIVEVTKDWGWGTNTGTQILKDAYIKIGTLEDVDMMSIRKPMTVTFIIKELKPIPYYER